MPSSWYDTAPRYLLRDRNRVYDAPPPNLPAMGAFTKWLVIGVLPQLTIWIWFTVTIGSLFGAVVAAVMGRARRPSAE